jgi:integrase
MLREETEDPTRVFAGFELYILRHTCLTRWAPHMDPWTLAYLAGHRDMNITKRYIHPQEQTIREAMEKAREVKGGHSFGHTAASTVSEQGAESAAIN